jgi:hypothetical protein
MKIIYDEITRYSDIFYFAYIELIISIYWEFDITKLTGIFDNIEFDDLSEAIKI